MSGVVMWRRRSEPGEANARTGMRILIAAWTMMFVALFFTWAFVRAGPGADASPDARVPSPALAVLATVCLVGTSGSLFLASRSADAGRRKGVRGALLASLALAVGAVALEVLLILEGRRLRMGGSYGSLLLTMIAFTVMQAGLGLPALAILLRRALAGAYGPGRALGIRLWASYWYAVLALWFAVALVIYLT